MPTLRPDGRRLCGSGSKWITKKRRARLYAEQCFTCHWCARNLFHAAAWECTLDHLIPRRLNGPHADWNLVMACKPCNDKRNRPRRERDSLRTRAGRKCARPSERMFESLTWAETFSLHLPNVPAPEMTQ